MLFRRDTPSSVMFDDLRKFGGISNIEAARMLLSAKISYGGTSPRDRAEDRTYLSRNVVHLLPDDVDASQFADFEVSTLNVSSRLLARHGHDRRSIVEHYLGDVSSRMCTALNDWGRDSKLYSNELRRLSGANFRREEYRSTLLLMLFLVTGCLANAKEAVAVVEDYSRHRLSEDIETISDDYGPEAGQGMSLAPVTLGLLRLIGDVAYPPILPLNPNGTIVGSLADGPGAIWDVGGDVSRQHLRIWRNDDIWLCQGMHSTNGTTLISGVDGQPICVEPPRSKRSSKIEYPPQELREGDKLLLGTSTEFLVMRVKAETGELDSSWARSSH